MENQTTPESNIKASFGATWQSWLTMKTALPVCALLIVLSVLYYYKGIFVAATVNGSPISRLSVVQALEKQGGKQTLDSLVDEKLIETELNKQNITVPQEDIDEEIKNIEEQVASQGGTLDQALEQQGMTREKLIEQITIQKRLEKLLADKIAVTDADVDAYLTDSKATSPDGVTMEDFRKQTSEQLKGQKFQQEAQKWVSDLTTSAKIKYFVSY